MSECLIGKAHVLFALQQYEEAQASNREGLQIAKEIDRKEYILSANVLSAKIDFALGNGDAPDLLEEMLQHTENEIELAVLHYELWKMTSGDEHRQVALSLYQKLYATTPNIEYKTRREELLH